MRGKYLFICSLAALLFCSCKKDHDQPHVAITSPSSGQTFTAGTTIEVKGNASDGEGLARVEISLLNADNVPINGLQSQNLSGTRSDFSQSLTLGDLYTATGTYTIKAEAYDKYGESQSAYVSVTINEIPFQFIRAYYAGSDGANECFLDSVDSNYNSSASLKDLGNGITDFRIDSHYQLINACFSKSANFDSYYANDLSLHFSHTQANGGGMIPAFQRFIFDGGLYYITSHTGANIRLLNSEGGVVSGANAFVDLPNAIEILDDFLYGAVEGIMFQNTIEKLNKSSFSGITQKNLSMEIKCIAHNENGEICTAGQSGANGLIKFLQASDLAVLFPVLTITGEQIIMWEVYDNTIAYLLTDAGVYKIDLNAHTNEGKIIDGSFNCLAYERLSNQLWLGRNNEIKIFSASSVNTLLQTASGVTSNVQRIGFLYNK